MAVIYGAYNLQDLASSKLTDITTGIMYLTLATFSSVWIKEYGESVGISGLNYLSLGLGFMIGVQVSSSRNVESASASVLTAATSRSALVYSIAHMPL